MHTKLGITLMLFLLLPYSASADMCGNGSCNSVPIMIIGVPVLMLAVGIASKITRDKGTQERKDEKPEVADNAYHKNNELGIFEKRIEYFSGRTFQGKSTGYFIPKILTTEIIDFIEMDMDSSSSLTEDILVMRPLEYRPSTFVISPIVAQDKIAVNMSFWFR